ncbi:hypothetical protein [Luteimonas deserti]|uniref:Nuclear transport factor 2 family protein n=1 Tax=Luteimonas deserti TaxID=2752306 RepID=A0A7Z0TZ85_9GAMM|nr:hypothetical protein [Luteimonas deserti]NYZ63680.1 hypothetical protein [Luteimonas deserti]
MSHRRWWLAIATLLLLGIALAVHEATRAPGSGPGAADDAAGASGALPDGGPPSTTASREASDETGRVTVEAVDTVHAYLAALFSEDRAQADAYWLDGRPASSGESDLRALTPVTGIRVDNGRPEPLDTGTPPTALQIPVRMRIGGDGPLRRYNGHYRLRRVDGEWRITSASIDPSPGAR